uniref:Ig-like domain-containing protein n=1 Tax=Biomphalaria glabrata TaxID=6526 RepID=A0A2C9M2C2_BIOGL
MMLSVLVYLTVTVLLHCATAADTVQPFIYSLSNMYAEKANATLVCSVRSSSLPMFQWTTTKGRVSGKAVTRTMRDADGTTYYENFYNFKVYSTDNDADGTTYYENFYNFKVYSTDNDAKFTCKINLEGTAYTSEPFKLFVVVPPLIPSITGPASVFESNAKYTFQCDVRGGTMTAPTVVFRYEGEEIADGVNTNITVRIGSNGLELQVSKVLRTKIPRDVKLYVLECESTTDFADTAATRKQYKQVVVYWTKPRTYPNSAEERVYDTAHKVLINCTMRADDLSSIRWESGYLKSEPVTTLKGSYFEEGSKMFWSAQIFAISSNDHEREYVCVATNIALVDIRSDPIRILVYSK